MENFQDIPKIYTAVAEWLACVAALFVYREYILRKRAAGAVILALSLVLLTGIQIFCGRVSNWLWLLGMTGAVLVMILTLALVMGIIFPLTSRASPPSSAGMGFWFSKARMSLALIQPFCRAMA